ncbi:STIV orfB116 family protein [Caldisericum sp.]|uniref:STIV orfB116 family protein n=1 Tax=Caldisericum sp. TaxID=2499687 RepID=UPI003D0E1313
MSKKFYLLNSFSPSMFGKQDFVGAAFQKISFQEAKEGFNSFRSRGYEIISAIGHEGTARLLSQILDYEVPFNRIQITLSEGDIGLIITLAFRPEEGRVYNYEELKQFFDEGKIVLYAFIIT